MGTACPLCAGHPILACLNAVLLLNICGLDACRARTKRIAGVKNLDIYALGLFVDPSAVRGALQGKFRGADPASLAKDQKLFDGEQGQLPFAWGKRLRLPGLPPFCPRGGQAPTVLVCLPQSW